jgi:type III restriction enzyme
MVRTGSGLLTVDADSSVLAFCKISENRHDFVRLRYVKEDGLPAFYSTDFLLRTDKAIYLVETKAQGQLSSPNVQRKLKSAAAWCDRVNTLPVEDRSNLPWHYVLLSESMFWEWRDKDERLAALCDFARIRNTTLSAPQVRLESSPM